MTETYNEKNLSIIGMLLGAIFVTAAFIRDNGFYAVVALFFFLLVFASELDIYLSRRAGRDQNKDYTLSENDNEIEK